MKDLQTVVGKRVVNEAEDALAAVHDIPETMTDSTLYASVSTGAVPSAEDMDRVFTKWHEQVQLSVAAGVEMAQQRGMPLPPDSGNASLLVYSRESPLAFVHWIDATQHLKKIKSGCLSRFGWEVRVLDGRFVYLMPSAYHASISTTLISLSCLLTLELRWRRLAKRIAQMCLQTPSDFMTCSRSP